MYGAVCFVPNILFLLYWGRAYLIRGLEELEDPLIKFLLLGIAGECMGLRVLCQIFFFAQ